MSHGWPPTAIAGSSKRELMKRSAPRTTKVCLTTAFRWRTSLIFELRLRVEEVRAGHDLGRVLINPVLSPGWVDVRFAQKATELLRGSEMTRWADFVAKLIAGSVAR